MSRSANDSEFSGKVYIALLYLTFLLESTKIYNTSQFPRISLEMSFAFWMPLINRARRATPDFPLFWILFCRKLGKYLPEFAIIYHRISPHNIFWKNLSSPSSHPSRFFFFIFDVRCICGPACSWILIKKTSSIKRGLAKEFSDWNLLEPFNFRASCIIQRGI